MSDETKIINAHDRIWLQVGEDFLPGDIDFNELSESPGVRTSWVSLTSNMACTHLL
ncbi:hypothetical protein P3T23_005054 [Paraburkholderia sp. GAS448]|uniref:hypothetical protein n=1 Tax=Paraburkholderia sp. GAS448 TaxID=3035136 RepID=UPI003D1DA80E